MKRVLFLLIISWGFVIFSAQTDFSDDVLSVIGHFVDPGHFMQQLIDARMLEIFTGGGQNILFSEEESYFLLKFGNKYKIYDLTTGSLFFDHIILDSDVFLEGRSILRAER